jgi:hypothetical protein
MTDTMIERVARAALDAYYPQSIFSREHPEREKFRLVALAAIAAMREPTEAMRDAGFAENFGKPSYAAWQAMIDAALTEGAPE